jgi:Uma2 family endonuclease
MDAVTTLVLSDYEIERGKPMPSKLHALLTQRITVYLTNRYPQTFEVYPELTLDTPGERMTPDVSICEKEPIDFTHDLVREPNPPLATIEILSPTQVLQTLIDKTYDYFSFGVKSCWIVLPTLQSIYVFRAPGVHEAFTLGEVLSDPNLGIQVPMDELFAR